MHVRQDSDTQALIRARMDRLDLMTRVLGCESDTARAELTGMSTRHWRRARDGYVGSVFIANTLVALRGRERELIARNLRPSFDELFEVVVVPRGGEGENTE